MSLPRLSAAAWLILTGFALAVVATAGAALVAGGTTGVRSLVGARDPAVAALVAAAGLGCLTLFVGLVLYVVGPSLSPETAARGYASYRTMLATLAVAAVPANLVSLAYVVATAPPGQPAGPSPDALVVAIVALELALLGVLYLRVVRPGVLTWRDLGLTSDDVGRRVAQGIGAGVGLILLVALLEAALRAVGVEQTQLRVYEGIRGAPLWQFLVLVAAGALLAPFAEEAFFRGYIFTACRREKGPWQAYLFSAGLFAAVHFNLPSLLPIFTIGLGFAFVYACTGSLVPGVLAHGLNNAVALVALYLGPALPG